MRTLRPSSIGYAEVIDHLYIAFGDSDLTTLDHEDEVGPWITVQYSWPDGELAGIEIYGLKEHFGNPPLSIMIPAREPFIVEIPELRPEETRERVA